MTQAPSSPVHAQPAIKQMSSDPRPPRHPWSDQDLAALLLLGAENLDDTEIAHRLGRTPRAVRTMILRLGGKRLRDASPPWTSSELDIVIQMHASGAICAVIAEALPGRTPIAVFRKLCRLVGPAPSAEAKRSWRCKKHPAEAPIPAERIIQFEHPAPFERAPQFERPAAQLSPPPPTHGAPPRMAPPCPEPPLQPIPAPVDAMVRWLRSRDFMVLRKDLGWRIDHHQLSCDEALVEFVNLRRHRLHLAPFTLIDPPPMPVAIASEVVRPRRWGQSYQARHA